MNNERIFMGKNIRIEELTPEQLVHGLLSSYSRRQEVTRVYRYVEGQRVVKDLYFVEDWDEKEKDDHVDEMIEVVSKGGNAFAIYPPIQPLKPLDFMKRWGQLKLCGAMNDRSP